MKTKDPIFEPALRAATAMTEQERYLRAARFYQASVDFSLRKLLTAMGAKVPTKERLAEFGERFYHHIRALGGGHLTPHDFGHQVNSDYGAEVVAAANAALKTMGIERVAKKLEL